MATYAELTPMIACRALREAGVSYPAETLHIACREERWAVSLPDSHIAWFPTSESGARRLGVERRVLGLLANRCSFQVPEILFVSNAGFDLRRMVPGRCDPWGFYRRCQTDPELTRRIGRSLGAFLTQQHTRIVEADVAGWLPMHVAWPEAGAWIRERLPRVVGGCARPRRHRDPRR